MKVYWTDTADGHLDALYAYIAQDSPEYAKGMVDRLTQRSQQIADFLFSGRRVPEYDIEQIREVIEGPYRIIYHIKPDQIDGANSKPWRMFVFRVEGYVKQRSTGTKPTASEKEDKH